MFLTIVSLPLAIAFVVESARRTRWRAPMHEHLVWAGATAVVFLGYQMSFVPVHGLAVHFLGAAALALIVGYPRAVVSMAIVIAADSIWHQASLAGWGLDLLVSGVLPIWVAWLVVSAAKRWLPRNPFVFFIGCAFFGVFGAYALTVGVSALLHATTAPTIVPTFWSEYLPYQLLLAWGEAWLEGALITLLVVYLPGSVRLFDESFYLRAPARQ